MQLTMTSIPVTVHNLSPHHRSLDSRDYVRLEGADQLDGSPAPMLNPAARVMLSPLASDRSGWDPPSSGFPAPVSFQRTASAIR